MFSTAQLALFVLPVSVIAIDAFLRFIRGKRQGKGLPLPPGPTQIPLLGSALQVNFTEPWKTYTEWHCIHGDVVYLRLLDQEVIVLGSQSTAVELLERRSKLYSDRPVHANLLAAGAETNFAFTPYGDHWRSCRRIFHQTFRAEAAVSFRSMQLRRARQLVLNIMDDPKQYRFHYSTFSMAVAMSAVYGYEPNVRNDPIVHITGQYLAAAMILSAPECGVLLKLFPFLLHIPDWFPGSKLKLESKRARDLAYKMMDIPYQHVADRMACNESSTNSMVSDHIIRMQRCEESEREEYVHNLKVTASTSIINAGGTTVSSLMVFTLAMVSHPQALNRAQAEIHSVVGSNKLPDYDDRPSLPYVEAILRETVRWMPVAPLGVWHATTDDDAFNGLYIPKGATVVANVWAMSRDEARYPNAEEFIPERFITEKGTLTDDDPMDFIFGFGRRVCPGRSIADASLWIAITTMLATLDFGRIKDAQGNDVPFEPIFVNGVTRRLETFPCTISPRSHIQRSSLEQGLAI